LLERKYYTGTNIFINPKSRTSKAGMPVVGVKLIKKC